MLLFVAVPRDRTNPLVSSSLWPLVVDIQEFQWSNKGVEKGTAVDKSSLLRHVFRTRLFPTR